MSTTLDADESALLLGSLALRLDLARRDALIDAFNSWARDRGQTFADRMRETRAVPPEAVTLLEDIRDRLVGLHSSPRDALQTLRVGSDLAPLSDRLLDPALRSTITACCPETVPASTVTGRAAADAGWVEPALGSDGPRFSIRRLHARGGLGEVFVAHDESFGRDVALKEIKPRYADDPESRSRFVREARITGSLEHPGIVPVYALGQNPDGRPFYAMRFIDGETLSDTLDRFHGNDGKPTALADPGVRSLELRRLLSRFVDVCHAVHFAHTRGVLHRDLKPANIMLGRFGEAIVVDWGLGKTLGERPTDEDESGWTLPGTTMGTPSYMSPEQASGNAASLGPATDVYSLGATLFAVLTGRAPIEGKGREQSQVLNDVRRGQFPRPREVRREVSRTLEAVCLKAMALKPAHRYETAAALAEDVERWLAGEPVTAYREPVPRRVWRWGRRNRWVATAIGAVSVVIVTAFLFSSLLIAPLALILALVGGSVGGIVGVLQGKPTDGAQKGAEFGFRVGTIAILGLFVLWLAFVAYRLVTHPGSTGWFAPVPTHTSSTVRTPPR